MTLYFIGFIVSRRFSLSQNTKHFVFPLIIFTSCTFATLYTPSQILSSSCHRQVLFYFFFLALIIYWFLCNFLILFSVLLVRASTIKVKNDDYFGVFFVVNQDYPSFSCNLKFSCRLATIHEQCSNGVHTTIILLVLSIKLQLSSSLHNFYILSHISFVYITYPLVSFSYFCQWCKL